MQSLPRDGVHKSGVSTWCLGGLQRADISIIGSALFRHRCNQPGSFSTGPGTDVPKHLTWKLAPLPSCLRQLWKNNVASYTLEPCLKISVSKCSPL